MNKYEKLRTIVLIVGIIIVVFVIIVGGIIVIPKEEKTQLPKCEDIKLYNLKVGEEISPSLLEGIAKECNNKELYYEIEGYAKDDIYLKIYINTIKKEKDKYQTLDNKEISKTDTSRTEVYKNGTKYCYVFIKNNNKYLLKTIELQ